MYLEDFGAAELLQKQAVEIKARVHGDEHPITLLGMEKVYLYTSYKVGFRIVRY